MKFIFADALDMIDPDYDFVADRTSADRDWYWSDQYPHEYFRRPPYDGILVSRAIVGDEIITGKYPRDMSMRFRRVGAREFLRLNKAGMRRLPLFGDCGAFSYVDKPRPPYTTEMMLDFYLDGRFTHACSVDHVIFDFDATAKGRRGGSKSARDRYDITLENAREFIKLAKKTPLEPLGVVQGWSPDTMAQAAHSLERMGYRYLAVGGLVPLKSEQIHLCLTAIRAKLKRSTKLHLLGFAKADQVHEFTGYGVASFDSTSPHTRAFKDARANYYSANGRGALEYFTAIRVPHPTENPRLKRRARSTGANQEKLWRLDRKALGTLRAYDKGRATLKNTVRAVMDYSEYFQDDGKISPAKLESQLAKTEEALVRTLSVRPWKKCGCRVCKEAGIETIIFRGSNRNKRRGFHNLAVYYRHLRQCVN